MAGVLAPEEMYSYEGRRRQANLNYGQGVAQLSFDRGNIQERQNQDYAQLARTYARSRERLPGSFAQRGVLNSGIWTRGLEQHNEDALAGMQRAAQQYQEQFGQKNLDEQRLQQNLYSQVIDANEAERLRQAQLAAALQGL